MKATSIGGKLETNGKHPARRLLCVEARDRADEWEQTPTVAASRWTRTGPSGLPASQNIAPTRFLRLLNCRATLALLAGAAILSFGDVAWAQIGAQPTAAVPAGTNEDGIRLACTNVPLEQFLRNFMKPSGFAIHPLVSLEGRVTITNSLPLSREDALLTVESALAGNGYAVIVDSTILTIGYAVEVNRRQIPQFRFGELYYVPATTNIVSCIVPCRKVAPTNYARALMETTNLGPEMIVESQGNDALVVTGTGIDVRAAAAVMLAMDGVGANSSNGVQIFRLKYADAASMAVMLNDLFAAGKPTNGNPPLSGGVALGLTNRVFAQADSYSKSMVVSAPQEMMPEIRDLVQKLDQPIEDVTEVKLFHLKNADCTKLAKMLSDLFPKPAGVPTSLKQKMALVLAIPEPRTQSLIVSASKDLMPQIEDIINSLDTDSQNPDPNSKSVQDILKDLFPANGRKIEL